MEPAQIMTRSHLDNDRESDLRRYDTVHIKSTPESRNPAKYSRVASRLRDTPYTHARRTLVALIAERPWDTSVTRDLLVKSVIRR